MICQVWWLVVVIPILERLTKAEPDFKAILGNVMNLRLLSII